LINQNRSIIIDVWVERKKISLVAPLIETNANTAGNCCDTCCKCQTFGQAFDNENCDGKCLEFQECKPYREVDCACCKKQCYYCKRKPTPPDDGPPCNCAELLGSDWSNTFPTDCTGTVVSEFPEVSSNCVPVECYKCEYDCLTECPGNIIGDQCGRLTQDCGVGKNDSGQNTVLREVSFGGITCKEHTLTLNYDFGFSNDKVDFSAFLANGTVQNLGSTGCVSGGGPAVFILPELSVGLQVISTFACLASQSTFNSSINGFTITCT
jgi:hypothetical protein